MEPLRVTLKPGARPVKARPCIYNPVETAWVGSVHGFVGGSAACFPQFTGRVGQYRHGCTNKERFRLVRDFRAANQQVEKVPGMILNKEASMAKLSEARFYGSLDLLQGYWQCPLAPNAQKIFTIATPGGLYTPTRVPEGSLNVTSYFQETFTRVLEGLECMVWVDDVLFGGLDETDLVNTQDLILERLEEVGLYVAAHKCTFFETGIVWCGKVCSQGKSSTILSGWPAWLP